jgi:tetratricopeptide (TPR) repeat protein
VFAVEPEHPGVAHYLIHSYDYPPIAEKGLDAARRYASIAPSAPHAQHMPSHIFTRRGLWQDSIQSNLASAGAARGHFDVFHAWDYLAYAYLQQAQDRQARGVLDQLLTVAKPNMDHFVLAFAAAAIPARYALERGRWEEAAKLQLPAIEIVWSRFPQAEAILVFARGLGAARSGDAAAARQDAAARLQALRDALAAAKVGYWADQVDIQALVVSGWAAQAEGKSDEALRLLRTAADREDATEKHPVTPGPIVPARELLGELYLALGQPAEALREFEASQRIEPNRFRGLYGAAKAAELAGNRDKARTYYGGLVTLARQADTERPEIAAARAYLGRR